MATQTTTDKAKEGYMKFKEVRISITNEQGEVFAIHDIGTAQLAQYLLNDLDPYAYGPPEVETEPEPSTVEEIKGDIIRALLQLEDFRNQAIIRNLG